MLDETWLTRQRFFTSYFIDGRVFFRIFTFYIVFDDFVSELIQPTRVSDDRRYVCGRRLYACIITRKFKRNYTIASDQKRDEDMARHFNHRQKKTACSSLDSFAYNKSLQHPTSQPLPIKFFFDHWRVQFFQSYQLFQAIEFVDRPVLEKL